MSLKVVIIGAVAAGPKTGSRLKRVMPGAEVVMIDRDDIFSYGGCGIPYFVSGDVADISGLRTTSFHMVRDEAFFKGAKGIDVMSGWEAVNIDRATKRVDLKRVSDGEEKSLDYDKLVISTGSNPNVPPIPGADLPGVTAVANLHHAEAIKNGLARGQVGAAAVIGAGPTGLEMAEAMADLWGVEVHVFEMADQILPGLIDRDLALMVQHHLTEQEVNLHLSARVESIEGGEGGVTAVIHDNGQRTEVDTVIMAAGVRPETGLARLAGLELADNGGIKVDDRLRTSDPDIYAGGDCVALPCLLSGREVTLASGSLANRMGRVIGTNLAGGDDTFPPVAGSWIMKAFDLAVGKVGLSEASARAAGFDTASALVVAADRAHFYPTMELMYLKMVADRATGRVLGLSGVSPNGDALSARINAVAGMLPMKPTVGQVANLEMAYAPPYASAMDILNSTATALDNVLNDRLTYVSPEEFARLLEEPDPDTVLLDVRDIRNAAPYLEALADKGWSHLPQEILADNLDRVPRDKRLITICNAGSRSYEALITLKYAGFKDVFNLAGGVAAVKKAGWPIIPPVKD